MVRTMRLAIFGVSIMFLPWRWQPDRPGWGGRPAHLWHIVLTCHTGSAAMVYVPGECCFKTPVFTFSSYGSTTHISFPRSVRLAIEGRQHKLGAYFSMHLSRLCPSDMLCIILSSNLSLNCFGPPQHSHGNYKSKPFAVI